jgi:peptide/nickel transport system ATP-binding protein
MPRLTAIPKGCAFNPRCTHVAQVPGGRCTSERPGLLPAGKTQAACWLHAHQGAIDFSKASA